jgi:hypothetical protein
MKNFDMSPLSQSDGKDAIAYRYFVGKTVTGEVHGSPAKTFKELFYMKLEKPVILPCTHDEFWALSKKDRHDAKQVPYLVAATYTSSPSPRGAEHARNGNLLFLDLDEMGDGTCPAAQFVNDPTLLKSRMAPISFAAYTTASSTHEKPRMRIVVDADDIPLAAYPQAVRSIAERIGLGFITSESFIAVQPMYLPTLFFKADPELDDPMLIYELEGRPFQVSDILPNFRSGTVGQDALLGDSHDLEFLRAPVARVDLETVRNALEYINPDLPYPEWLRICAGLKHQFSPHSDEDGYHLFDEWSSKGDKYDDPDDTRKKWESVQPTPAGRRPITIRTLLRMAEAGGWQGSAFPVDALPAAVRDFVLECERVNKVPVGLPAMCCLAVASASVGAKLRVHSFHGKVTSANLMVLGAADTGSGKSEVFRECIAPFMKCQKEIRDEWRSKILPASNGDVKRLTKAIKRLAESADHETNREELTAKEAALAMAKAKTEEPCYVASDFTTQALIRMLCRTDGQLFTASPDAKNFVDMILGRYNDGGTDEEVYLKAFSLEPIDRHRVGDGTHQTPEACITGLWLTQQDKLWRLLREKSLSEGGLLPRLLMAHFNCSPLRVDLDEKGICEDARAQYAETVGELFTIFRKREEVRTIDANEDARQALVEYQNGIAERREHDLRDVTGFAARWGEYAWRIALVIHAIRFGKEASNAPLDISDANAGISIMRWFSTQQLDLLEVGRSGERQEKYDKVMKLLTAENPEIVARDVYRKHITPRQNLKLATALLDEMVDARLLEKEMRPTERKNHTQGVYRRPSR